jgi:hypothetical protein
MEWPGAAKITAPRSFLSFDNGEHIYRITQARKYVRDTWTAQELGSLVGQIHDTNDKGFKCDQRRDDPVESQLNPP